MENQLDKCNFGFAVEFMLTRLYNENVLYIKRIAQFIKYKRWR